MYTMQMHEFISSGISPQQYAIFDRKNYLKKINSKTGFQNQKPDFGFQTENRISGFRLTSLIIYMLLCLVVHSNNIYIYISFLFSFLNVVLLYKLVLRAPASV